MTEKTAKPTIKLTSLENTVVYIPTQEDYNQLMKVYECGGWLWYDGKLPTEINLWEEFRHEGTCVDAGIYGIDEDKKVEGKFGGKHIDFFERFNRKQIYPEDFYKIQGITSDMIDEICEWFDREKLSKEN